MRVGDAFNPKMERKPRKCKLSERGYQRHFIREFRAHLPLWDYSCAALEFGFCTAIDAHLLQSLSCIIRPGIVGGAMSVDKKGRIVGLLILGTLVCSVATNVTSGVTHSLASQRWPRVSARVVESSVYEDGRDVARRWEPDVVYQYTIGNQTFTSRRIRFLMSPIYQEEQASKISALYRQGRVVQVAYDPSNPSESVLQPGLPPGTLKQVLLAVFLVAITGYIYYEIQHPGRRILLRSFSEDVS